jgi:ribosomal protein L16 Arg81 hydroxylase
MSDKDLEMIQNNNNRITALEATFEYFKQSVEIIRGDIQDIKKKLDDKYVSKEYVKNEIDKAITASEKRDPFSRFRASIGERTIYIALIGGLAYALISKLITI